MKVKSIRFEGELEDGTSSDVPWSNLSYSATLFNLDEQVDAFSGTLFPPIFGLAIDSRTFDTPLSVTHAVMSSTWTQPSRPNWKIVFQGVKKDSSKKYIFPEEVINAPVTNKIGLLFAFIPNIFVIPEIPAISSMRTKLFREKATI